MKLELSRHETLSLVFEKLVDIRSEIEECDGEPGRTPAAIKERLRRVEQLALRACQIIEAHEKPEGAIVAANEVADLDAFLKKRGRTLIERTLFAAEGAQEVLARIAGLP